MERRGFLATLACGTVVGTAGCGGRESETPVKVANRREESVSVRLLLGRFGETGLDCVDAATTPTPVGESTLDGGETTIVTRLRETGTYRFLLELGGATHTNCAERDGTENDFVYVIETGVRFVRNDPSIGFPVVR